MNTTRFGYVATVVTLAFLGTGVAHAGIVETLREKYSPKTTIQADLDMTIYWRVREKKETKKGRVAVAPGDRFRVELDNTVWVCDGTTFWQYSSGSNQVVIKDLLDIDLSSHPSQILSTYLTDYDYTTKKENAKTAVLAWKADSTTPSSFYRRIEVTVDKKRKLVSEVFVVDRHGNKTTYRFSHTKLGETIAPETFTFEIPKGAHVLDARE